MFRHITSALVDDTAIDGVAAADELVAVVDNAGVDAEGALSVASPAPAAFAFLLFDRVIPRILPPPPKVPHTPIRQAPNLAIGVRKLATRQYLTAQRGDPTSTHSLRQCLNPEYAAVVVVVE